MSGGMSLNDVQLVQTYVTENTLALHVETFEKGMGRGNLYGTRTWVGGMALHLITDTSSPAADKSQEFAMMPGEAMADLAEKKRNLREKKQRKKAEQRMKKEEEAATHAALMKQQ